jgi:hypothetical protein
MGILNSSVCQNLKHYWLKFTENKICEVYFSDGSLKSISFAGSKSSKANGRLHNMNTNKTCSVSFSFLNYRVSQTNQTTLPFLWLKTFQKPQYFFLYLQIKVGYYAGRHVALSSKIHLFISISVGTLTLEDLICFGYAKTKDMVAFTIWSYRIFVCL